MGTCGSTEQRKNRLSASSNSQTPTNSNIPNVEKPKKEPILPKPRHLNETTITLTASLSEIDSGLCVNDGDTLEIEQIPFSKWSFQEKEVDFNGNPLQKYLDIPIGALMLRVSTEREVIHINKPKYIISFNKSGNLFFFANLDEEKLNTYKPQNKLSIKIAGNFGFVSKVFPFVEVSKMENIVFDNIVKEILYLINKVRVNPKKFLIERILFSRYIRKEISTDVDILYSFTKQLNEVIISDALMKVAQDHADTLEKTSLNGQINPNDPFVKQQIPSIEFRSVILYGCEEAFDIVIEILNNKQNKETILQERFNLFGIGFQTHLVYQRIIVIIFGRNTCS